MTTPKRKRGRPSKSTQKKKKSRRKSVRKSPRNKEESSSDESIIRSIKPATRERGGKLNYAESSVDSDSSSKSQSAKKKKRYFTVSEYIPDSPFEPYAVEKPTRAARSRSGKSDLDSSICEDKEMEVESSKKRSLRSRSAKSDLDSSINEDKDMEIDDGGFRPTAENRNGSKTGSPKSRSDKSDLEMDVDNESFKSPAKNQNEPKTRSTRSDRSGINKDSESANDKDDGLPTKNQTDSITSNDVGLFETPASSERSFRTRKSAKSQNLYQLQTYKDSQTAKRNLFTQEVVPNGSHINVEVHSDAVEENDTTELETNSNPVNDKKLKTVSSPILRQTRQNNPPRSTLLDAATKDGGDTPPESAEKLMKSIEQPVATSSDLFLRYAQFFDNSGTTSQKENESISTRKTKGIHEIDKALRKLGQQCLEQATIGRKETQPVLNVLINPELAPDVATLLMHVLNYIAGYHRPDPTEDLDLPKDEKAIVSILFQIEKLMKLHLRNLVSSAVLFTPDIIVRKQPLIAPRGLASLCRFLTEICRRRSDWRTPLRLCCEIAKRGSPEAVVRQFDAICGVWKDIFVTEFEQSAEKSIVLKSLFYVLSHQTVSPRIDVLKEGICQCENANFKLIIPDLVQMLKRVALQPPHKKGSLDAEHWISASLVLFCKPHNWEWIKLNLLEIINTVIRELHTMQLTERAISAFANLCVDVFLLFYPERFQVKVLLAFFNHFLKDNDTLCGIYALCLVRMHLEHRRDLPADVLEWLKSHRTAQRDGRMSTLLRKRLVSENTNVVLRDLLEDELC